MEILLHICCGPCSIYPVTVLKDKGFSIRGFFFNPNIHPFLELERRIIALETVSNVLDFPVIWDTQYGLKDWLDTLDGKLDFNDRCLPCYAIRLEETAKMAVKLGIKTISTTLLYSKYQRHDKILEIGNKSAFQHGLEFYYEDFRQGWQKGIEASLELGIYRQPYCGCIFSEAERYSKRMNRLMKRLEKKNNFLENPRMKEA